MTRLVRRMRNLLEIELGEIWVEGEISNLRRQASGHCYFTLKDEGAQVSCVLFRGSASRAKAKPEDGMQVRLFGEVSVYEARGQVQLIVREVEDAGMGDLQAKFEALKRKLNEEGLFAQEDKKALPFFPRKIALVTSPTGAALQDMLNVLGRRAPWVDVYTYPVQVQGKGAERGIADAIHQLGDAEKYNLPEVDVIIVGRGGGSLEDLWNFNEECVARAIYTCSIPIVSAVGHEIDFTIADFAADVRAPTPSAAAELVVPDGKDLRERVMQLAGGMKRIVRARIELGERQLLASKRALLPRDVDRVLRERVMNLDRVRSALRDVLTAEIQDRSFALQGLKTEYQSQHPERIIDRHYASVERIRDRLEREGELQLKQCVDRLKTAGALLRTLGPEQTLARGFSMTLTEDGKPVTSVSDVQVGDRLTTHLADGQVASDVAE